MSIRCICCGFSSLQYPYYSIGDLIKCPLCGGGAEFLEEEEDEDGLEQEDNPE